MVRQLAPACCIPPTVRCARSLQCGYRDTADVRMAAGEPKLLSEQFLMDCSWPEGNTACNGGFQDKAFVFAIASQGIPANADYPYVGVNMGCKSDARAAASIRAYVNVRGYRPQELKEALLTKGPMTVSLDADAKAFRFYKSGIYLQRDCTVRPPSALDHAVIISGYGRDPRTGQRYWILKNIWSTWWGEGGYMRIDMDQNDCGVSALPEYVLLDTPHTDALRAASDQLPA
jgi:cathepsin L